MNIPFSSKDNSQISSKPVHKKKLSIVGVNAYKFWFIYLTQIIKFGSELINHFLSAVLSFSLRDVKRIWFYFIYFICCLNSSISNFLSETFLSISSISLFFIVKSDFSWTILIEIFRLVLFNSEFHFLISYFF